MTHPTPDSQITPRFCTQCGSPLTEKGSCSRTVGLFVKPKPDEPTLDPVIADLISKYITPKSSVGKLIAERILTLVEEARKEVQGWKDIAESNRQAYADALHVNQYRDEGEIGAGFETVTLFTQNDIADLIELTKKVDANIHPSIEKLRRLSAEMTRRKWIDKVWIPLIIIGYAAMATCHYWTP